MVNEAKALLNSGDREGAIQKADQALDACKEAIAQKGNSKIREIVENKLYRYLVGVTAGLLLLGIGYYSFRRIKLRRARGVFVQQDIKNKK
jgi:hypothetical protein